MKRFSYFVAATVILAGCLLTTSCKKEDKTPVTGFEIENIVFMNENDEVVTGSEIIDSDGNTHEYVLINTETYQLFTGSAKWTINVNGRSLCTDEAVEKTGTEYIDDAWYVKIYPNTVELYANAPVVFSITAKDAFGKALTLNVESI